MKNIKLIIVAMLINISWASSQVEFIVNVDPVTGSFIKIEDISELEWIQVAPNMTAMNETEGHYIFNGIDNTSTSRLYSIEVSTGQTAHFPPFPILSDPLDNVIQLQMDNKNNILYGLSWDDSEQTEYFVEIDPATGIITYISPIPDVNYIAILPSYTTYNKWKSHYYFMGITFSGESKLFTILATDGSIVSSIDFPVLTDPMDNVGELQYNNADSTIYALHWDSSSSTEYLGSVDINDGSFTPLFPLYDVQYITIAPKYTTFDELNGRYIFRGVDFSGVNRLYSVDVYTGAVLSEPEFPILEDPDDNVIELKFNNGNGKLYGLHWDAEWELPIDTTVVDSTMVDTTEIDTISTDILDPILGTFVQLYPNPVNDYLYINMRESGRYMVLIYDLNGNQVLKEIMGDNDFISPHLGIDLSHLSSGVYKCMVVNIYENKKGETHSQSILKL